MKVFSKKLIISFLLCISLDSFPCGYYPNDNVFRICNFDANFLNFKELNAFILQTDYLNGDIKEEKYNWKDNIDQWYKYCNSAKVKKQDIYSALYRENGLKSKNNTFISYIKESKKEAYLYISALLNLEPRNEPFTHTGLFCKVWDSFEANEDFYTDEEAFSPVSPEFDFPNVLNNINNCKTPFLQKRWAYQAIISAYYESKPLIVQELFIKYFTRVNREWIDNSAQHYYGLVSKNKPELLLECIKHGYDKLTRNIELLSHTKDFNESFSLSLNDQDRSYYYFVKCIREYGRGLPLLKKVYQLNPQNKYLDFLINREVNKIENWVQTPKIITDHIYFTYLQYENSQRKSNYQRDLDYAREFLLFVKGIKEKSLYHDIVIAYVQYLLNIKEDRFDPEKYKNTANQYVQARVVDFLLNFDKKAESGQYKTDLLYIFNHVDEIDKDESYLDISWQNEEYDKITTKGFMRQQLARNLGTFMIRYPKKRAEGFLLTGKSELPQNAGVPFYGQSIYLNLSENASIEDCKSILDIIKQKPSNDYIEFLQKDEVNEMKIHYCSAYNGSEKGSFDPIKIQDIIAQKYVGKEKFDEAIKIYKKFPKEYWVNACEEMPFVININSARNAFGNKNVTFFNKLTFLVQMADYIKLLKKEPNAPLINYYVANAYYSMTVNGCFWYIAKLYNGSENFADGLSSKFRAIAKSYYDVVLKNSNDKQVISSTLMTLKGMNELKEKKLNTTNFSLYENIKDNCDLYTSYLSNLSSNYSSTINIKPTKVQLAGFKRFDLESYEDYY